MKFYEYKIKDLIWCYLLLCFGYDVEIYVVDREVEYL